MEMWKVVEKMTPFGSGSYLDLGAPFPTCANFNWLLFHSKNFIAVRNLKHTRQFLTTFRFFVPCLSVKGRERCLPTQVG